MRQHYHAVLCVALFVAPASNAATYKLQRLTFHGATSIDAIAINDAGVIAGTYSIGACTYGFAGKPGAFKALPGSCTAVPVPSGIDDANRVIGTISTNSGQTGFVYQGTQLLTQFALGMPQSPTPPPFIDRHHGLITYNVTNSSGLPQGYAGPIGNVQPEGDGTPSVVTSVSSDGHVCGQALGQGGQLVAYVTYQGMVTEIVPPGSTSTYGSINESGTVGGYYFEGGVERGFIYNAGKYKTFIHGGAASLTVDGINGLSDVVGTYGDATKQHAYVYNHGKMSKIGAWPPTDSVTAAINDLGDLIIAHTAQGKTDSYLAVCSGANCTK